MSRKSLPRILGRIFKPLLLFVMALLLFVAGAVAVVYSPWFQDELRVALVKRMNAMPDTQFALGKLRLWFPLRVELGDVSLVQHGDTVVALSAFDGRVSLEPLLRGEVDVVNARLCDAMYRIGNRDSATCMVIRAGRADIAPARVRLSDMNICLEHGVLDDALVDLYINPNPPAKAPADTAAASPMTIDVRELDINRLTYRMSLLPTIDSLGVSIAHARLAGTVVSLVPQTVNVGSLTGSGLSAAYIVPDSATIANTVVAPTDTTTSSAPWTVQVKEFRFDKSEALYTTRGVKPLPGLDFGYIAVSDVSLAVTDFYNQASDVRIPVSLTATERCGVTLSASGTLDIGADGLAFKSFDITTPRGTSLAADGFLGTGDLMADPSVPVSLKASGTLSTTDAGLMFPDYKAYLKPLASGAKIATTVDVAGNMGRLAINKLSLGVPSALTLNAKGYLANVNNPEKLNGDVAFDGTVADVNPWLRLFMTAGGLRVPSLTYDGHILFSNGDYSGTLEARTAAGAIALDGAFRGRGSVYSIDLDANRFPVDAFMPDLGVGDVTATVSAKGAGFDFMSPATRLDASLDIPAITYSGTTYRDISGTVSLHDGEGALSLTSANTGLDFALDATARLHDRDYYDVDASFRGTDIDLERLGLVQGSALLTADVDVDASFNASFSDLSAKVTLNNLSYVAPGNVFDVNDVIARVNANDTLTNASVRNRDLYAFFSAPMGLDSLAADFANVGNVMALQAAEHRVSPIEVQRVLPQFRLDIDAGNDNMITQILRESDIAFDHFAMQASNDSVVNLTAQALSVTSGSTRLDTVAFDAHQHGERLDYTATINNRPGTFDEWAHVLLGGYFENNRLGISMQQHNIAGKMGFDVGANVSLYGDSVAVLQFDKLDPTIAYKPWTVNKDNFIAYHFTHRHLDANLRMNGAGSSVALYTEHALDHDEAAHGSDEDLVLELGDVKIQDWVSFNPFAPPVKGNLSANMRVNWEGDALTGDGTVSLTDLIYGKERVGDIKADVDVLTKPSGLINADVALWVDGQKSLTLTGALNDSTATSPFNLDLTMIHFPLRTVNAFLPGVARLTGTLNGSLDVSGDQKAPRLNGTLDFDSATVNIDMLGSTLTIGSEPIPVVDNVITFDKFAITACNENPLTIDGTVDIANLAEPHMKLRLDANNMLLVDTKKAPRGADIYGKAYVGVGADVIGTTQLLNVKGNVSILSGTNVTYILPDATSDLSSQSAGDMVKFVNFTDTTAVAQADSIAPPSGMLLNLDATLTVQGGSTITVNLDSKGTNRVQLKSEGSLHYTMNPLNTGRMTGRLNINGGSVRYSPPMMSEKLFDFSEGSYVAFNGEVMNPLLNIHAVDRVRANVTQSGQNSRLIYFDVLLAVTGSLERMDVTFDLATDDDATVANELATMSPTQRASAAMNLLITNMYTGAGTKATASLGGNALYSFLTSTLNTWAANTIKGVDLSFGIDQYDRTADGATSQTTSYSYRVSKTLFNDRFKIIIGGNYSTDDDANQNLAQNLVNDVSIEYMLNKSGSMYVRIFRHTGYESILEGEITQTGVGFVYKRKINRLSDMFRWARRRRKTKDADNGTPQATTAPDLQPITKSEENETH